MWWNGASCFEFNGKSMETETTAWLEFLNGGKAIIEEIMGSKKKKKIQKSRTVRVTVGIQVGKVTLWVRLFEVEKL